MKVIFSTFDIFETTLEESKEFEEIRFSVYEDYANRPKFLIEFNGGYAGNKSFSIIWDLLIHNLL